MVKMPTTDNKINSNIKKISERMRVSVGTVVLTRAEKSSYENWSRGCGILCGVPCPNPATGCAFSVESETVKPERTPTPNFLVFLFAMRRLSLFGCRPKSPLGRALAIPLLWVHCTIEGTLSLQSLLCRMLWQAKMACI